MTHVSGVWHYALAERNLLAVLHPIWMADTVPLCTYNSLMRRLSAAAVL